MSKYFEHLTRAGIDAPERELSQFEQTKDSHIILNENVPYKPR